MAYMAIADKLEIPPTHVLREMGRLFFGELRRSGTRKIHLISGNTRGGERESERGEPKAHSGHFCLLKGEDGTFVLVSPEEINLFVAFNGRIISALPRSFFAFTVMEKPSSVATAKCLRRRKG